MSRLDDIKDQLKSRGAAIWEKIQESEVYQQLSDRYQSLTPGGQRGVTIGAVVLGVGIVVFYPLSQIQTSSSFVEAFESKRNLIRDMFKVYRESSGSAQLSQAPATDALISSVNGVLQASRLLPEQIITVGAGTAEGKLIPPSLLSEVVQVQLSKLNIRQVVEIGTALANISESVKVKDLALAATEQMTGYFDVTYKLYALNVPPPPVEAPPEIETKPKKKGKAKSEDSKNEDSE